MYEKLWCIFVISCMTLFRAYGRNDGVAALPFSQGEYLEYQVYYSFIHAGTAVMRIDQDIHDVASFPCYKLVVEGVSNSALKLLGMTVCNKWESYLHVDSLKPMQFLAHIQENNYIRKEHIQFDYQENKAKIEIAESSNGMQPIVSYCPIPNAVKDFVSGYYALRNVNVSQLKVGDKLSLDVLHDHHIYSNVGVAFLGKSQITTKLGKISVLVFAPMVPTEGSIFTGERPVEVFISDDANKIPIKLKANLVIGTVDMELSNYKGLKTDILFQKT